MKETKSFSTNDTYFGVTSESPSHDMFTRGKEGDWESYRAVREMLKESGYVFHDDPRRLYKSLRRTMHAGSKGDIHLTSEIYPAGFRFEFYEDVVRDNPNGGRYHFNKLEKMPYLRRQKVILAHRKIAEVLMARGFADGRDKKLPPLERIMESRRRDRDWRRYEIVIDGQPDYNVCDQDGIRLKDGDIRSYWSRNGRLQRGAVYYDMNSMWWVISAPDELDKESAHEFFQYDHEQHGRKLSRNPLINISHALESAVKARNFKKAGAIQEAISRIYGGLESLSVGDRVKVDNPRFHGKGTVEWLDSPFWVGVKVDGSGNTWRYEWATVKLAEQACGVS